MRKKDIIIIVGVLIFLCSNVKINSNNKIQLSLKETFEWNSNNTPSVNYDKDNDNYIYVSSTGNDYNTGTYSEPIKSLNKAFQTIQNDKLNNTFNIILMGGIHQLNEPLNIRNNKKNITIKSISPRTAIIEGTQTLDNKKFTLLKGDILRIPVSQDVFQLIVNDQSVNLSHSENIPFLMSTIKSFSDISKYDNNKNVIGEKYYYKVGLDPIDMGKVEIGSILRISSWWKEELRKVSKILDRENAVIIESKTKLFIDYAPYVGEQYCIYNSSVLSSPGNYYLKDSNTGKFVYYKLKQTETINNVSIKIPVTNNLINIQSSNNIQIKDLIFRFNTDNVFSYTTPQANIDAVSSISCENCRNVSIENCEFYNIIGYAVSFKNGSSKCSINDSYIHQSCGGIIIGEDTSLDKSNPTNNIQVENNLIYDIGYLSWDAVGIILVHGNNCKIKYNTVMKTKYTGISCGWAWGFYDSFLQSNEISYNHIHHIMCGYLSDGAGIYTLGKQPNTKIAFNKIHDVVGAHEGMGRGIYFDTGSSYIDCFNNLVYGAQIGIFMGANMSNTIRNNIISYTNDFAFSKLNKKEWLENTIKNNLIYFDSGTLFENTVNNANINVNKNGYYGINKNPFRSSRSQISPIYFNFYFVDPLNGDFSFDYKKDKNIKRNLGKIDFVDFTDSMKDQYKENAIIYGPGIKKGLNLNYKVTTDFDSSSYINNFKKMINQNFSQVSAYFNSK